MDDEKFRWAFEKLLRKALSSTQRINVRPANNYVDITFGLVDDFVKCVNSACGANINCELNATYEGKASGNMTIESCVLRLNLANQCVDMRMVYFLYEICLASKSSGQEFTFQEAADDLQTIQGMEQWCSELAERQAPT